MNEKLCVYLGIPIALIATILIMYMAYKIERKNYCKQPYHKVCVKHHIENRLTPFFLCTCIKMKVGKTTMSLRPVKVCDIYELQLKKGCKDEDGKTNR